MKIEECFKTRRQEIIILIVIIILALFLRIYNTSELTGGDDSQFASYVVYAIEDPKMIFFNEFPDEPISCQGRVYTRPMTFAPIVATTSMFGYNKYSMLIPTLIFTILSIIVLYYFTKELFNKQIAFIATILFSFSPFHIIISRNAVLHSALIFYWLISAYLIVIAIKRKKIWPLYLAAFFCIMNQLTTDIRGLVPLLGMIGYIIFSKPEKRIVIHGVIAVILAGIFYIAYLIIPILLYNDPKYLNWFFQTLDREGVEGALFPIGQVVYHTATELFLTPLVSLIAIPMIVGIGFSIKRIKEPKYLMLLLMLATSIIFLLSGTLYTERISIYTPIFSILAAIGLYYTYKNNKLLIVLFVSAMYVMIASLLSISVMPQLNHIKPYFTALCWMVFAATAGLAVLFYGINRLKNKNKIAITGFLIAIIIIPTFFVLFEVDKFSRPKGARQIAEYISKNIEDEKYSCIGDAEYSKVMTYYTQKKCITFGLIDKEGIQALVEEENLKYVVIHDYNNVDDSLVKEMYPEEYDWVIQNTIDISDKIGIDKEKQDFMVLEFKR